MKGPLFLLSLGLFAIGLANTQAKSSETDLEEETTSLPGSPGINYVYKDMEGIPQNLEITLPSSDTAPKEKVPGLLLIHGGGWKGGSLQKLRYQSQYFASRGLVVANINYRMHKNGNSLSAGESRKRICVTDAKSAIRWFKQHASEWNMDPQRLIVGGGSAGGHIAVMSTLNSLDDPSDPKEIDTSVVAYLLFNPAFVGPGGKAEDNDDQVNPINFLRPGLAPFLFMFGAKDHWKPGSDFLIPKLRAQGAEVKLLVAENQKHGFFNAQPWADLTLLEADKFLVDHGLLKGSSPLQPPPSGEHLILSP